MDRSCLSEGVAFEDDLPWVPDDFVTSVNGMTGDVVIFSYGMTDLEAGVSNLETGKLYFVYE